MRLIERSITGISGMVPATFLAIALAAAAPTLVAQEAPALNVHYDADWWHAPQGKFVGAVSAVAVGPDGSVWVLHRPSTVAAENRANAAAPLLKYAPDGKFIAGYGGPGTGYDWPDVEHSLAIDAKGHIWITGNSRNDAARADDAILEFTPDGKFIKQIGMRGASKGDTDTKNVRAASDLFIDDAAGEIYVSDGYVNHRVIVFDQATGAFKRMWGAFGSQPPAQPPAGGTTATTSGNEDVRFFEGLHGIEVSKDGLVYVSDRLHQRVQIFTRDGKFQKQFSVDVGMAAANTASGIAFSTDPAQQYVYVADDGNSRIAIFDRKSLKQVASIGSAGADFLADILGPHLIAVGPDGALYAGQIRGKKVSRFTFSKK
jgi:DNA-binding beta-propeller fold protein YncE